MAQIYQENITVGGTYTGTIKTDYLVKVFPTGVTNTTKFQVITTNWDRNINLQFQGTSTAVKVRSDNGDGTYSDHATGIPIWVGDYLYETTGQTDISSAGNGYIGKVASITTGTEGVSVKAFALDATTYLDNISGSTKVDSVVKYLCRPYNDNVFQLCNDHQGSGNTYTHTRLNGLNFYWNTNFNSLPAPASSESYLKFMFTGYPQKVFHSDKTITLEKEGKTHILGWDKSVEQFSFLEDVYDENPNMGTVPTEQTYLATPAVDKEPTFVTRGDDTYIGLGPNRPPMYVGYPNIRQFGKNRGTELTVTDGAMKLDTSVLPQLEQFVLPTASAADAGSSDVDLTAGAQLVVGYVKGSSYLLKARRDKGIESSFYVGGKILAIYLDHLVSNEVWVLYDATSYYGVKCVAINASGTAMDLHENRVYSLQGADDNQKWLSPFVKDEVVPSDIILLDNILYISATDADYDNKDKNVRDKCFGEGANRMAFVWRSASVASAISPIPPNGYTTLAMTNMTPTMTTSSLSDNEEVTPYWYTWLEEEWWDEDPDGQGGNGGLAIMNAGFEGNGGTLKLKQLPAKRGLCIWANKAGDEAIGLLINYVVNSFDDWSDPVMDYDSSSDGDQYLGSSSIWKRVGPLVYQEGKHTALGSHIIVWRDSANHTAGNTTSSTTGVKRIMINNSERDKTTERKIMQQPVNSGSNADDEASITFIGDGSNWEEVNAINAVAPLNTNSTMPQGLSVTYDKNIMFFDIGAIGDAWLASTNKDGRAFLNQSLDDVKIFTPAESKPGPIIPASQSWNYASSSFEWLAVTFPDSFALRYTDPDGLESASWIEWALLSTVKITVGDTGVSDLDQNNVHPGADLNTSNDPPDYDEDSDYYKNFYRISLMLDGYQETVLGETIYTNSGNNPNKNGHKITIEVLADKLGPRMSHINVYRGKAWDASATEPDLDYQLVERVSLDGANWRSSSNGYLKYEIIDNQGKSFGTYEANTGLSPVMTNNYLSYGESEQCAGYLFVCDANNPEIANVGNYIFRSKAGKFSIFNWANEYVALPEKPTALKSYNNVLFAFSSSKVYTINPNNLSIIDSTDGMGCLHADSVIATDFGMFFADKHGVYQHDGRKAKVISGPIWTTDNSSLNNYTWDSISTSLETTPPKLAFDGQRKALIVVFEVSSNSYAWVYSVGTGRWDLWSFSNRIKSLTQGKYGDILASDGKLAQIGTSSTRKPWEFVSKKITAGLDTYDKSFTEVHVEGSNGLATTYKTSGVGTYQSLTSNRLASAYKKAKWLQLRVVDDAGTRELESIGVHLRPLKARSTKI